ncbi:hypothetical protein BY996DRAFT_6452590 [Phakopsora pachyrhizi]|nr:hypothetical protein BY996DRAFT_6452590 [Phakopsora pachyrhizi]
MGWVSRNAFASNSNLISRAGSASPWQFAIRGGSGWKKGGEEWGEAQHGIFAIGAEERRGLKTGGVEGRWLTNGSCELASKINLLLGAQFAIQGNFGEINSGLGAQYLIAIVGGHGWGKEGEEGGGLIGEDDEFVRKFEVSLRGLRPPEGVDQEQRGQQAEGSGWDGGGGCVQLEYLTRVWSEEVVSRFDPVGSWVEGLNGGDPEAEVEIPTAVKG